MNAGRLNKCLHRRLHLDEDKLEARCLECGEVLGGYAVAMLWLREREEEAVKTPRIRERVGGKRRLP